MAWTSGWLVMRNADAPRLLWLVPARDLFAFAVWLAGLCGRTVIWRGLRLRLERDGKIRS
jgi:ceramide glucosyltransferase